MLPVGGIERLLVAAVATAYVCPEITTQRPALFGLTSAPLDFVRRREERTLRDARSDRNAMPVAFYHEEGTAWPRGELPAEVASFAACAVDLFAAAPWVLKFAESLRDPASERRANLTKWLPRGLGEASAAAFLARKVAALDHAVARTPDGRSVVWLDVDCVLVKKPDGTFLGFLKTVDVATIARVPVRRERPETGVVALTGGAAARVFTRRAVALYEWGMADLGRRCLLRGPKARCRRHLSLNDVAVFKQLLVGDGEWRDPRLRVGWFAAGCASRDADRPWAAAALQYEQRGAHGDNFCHRDDHEEAVSPFNLFEYVAHMKGRSGVMGTKRRAPD